MKLSDAKYPHVYGDKEWATRVLGDRSGLTTEPRQLLLGCGHRRDIRVSRVCQPEWTKLVTLDMYPECKPDIVHDLNKYPWPIESNSFQEVHAYEVVEHLGQMGDWRAFFDFFAEVHRILEPNGFFMATVPAYDSEAAVGDPGHTRFVTPIMLSYLSQAEYTGQVDNQRTWMTDYRHYYKADFRMMMMQIQDEAFRFMLQAV